MSTADDPVRAGEGRSARRFGDPSTWSDLKIMSREDAVRAISLSPANHYVYVLCDERLIPFYVGKGTGKRALQHEADAWNDAVLSHKLNVIRQLRKKGLQVGYAIAAFFDNEAGAHTHERTLIAHYGRHDLRRGPLTNQVDGGEGALNPSIEVQLRRSASLGGQAYDPERRIANDFLASIAGSQDSVPIKPWQTIKRRAHLLRPSPNKPIPQPQLRMAKAIAASALANHVKLAIGAIIPRRLEVSGVELVIENGCGGDMIAAGMATPVEPRGAPLDERLMLTVRGFDAVARLIGKETLIDLGLLDP